MVIYYRYTNVIKVPLTSAFSLIFSHFFFSFCIHFSGKCAECLYCSIDGTCQGVVSQDFCHRTLEKRTQGMTMYKWAPQFVIKKMFAGLNAEAAATDEMK